MKKEKKSLTKEKIKLSAKKLFNEEDTISITTNHIAKEASISPGNLYYHYKNKEAIIKAIYDDMSKEFESFNGFELILNNPNPLKVLSKMYDKYIDLFWEYRFLLRDINVLILTYPKIKTIFLQRQQMRIEQIKSVTKYFISLNIIEPIDEKDIELNSKLNWFISSYWHSFSAPDGTITKKQMKETKDMVFKVSIYPYLTDYGKRLLKK
jgi:AcrR family transcriptional regulator